MSSPDQVGQISPDGRWRWDGQRWVPSGLIPTPNPHRGSRGWLWWIGGGCALLLVIGLAAGIWGAASLVRSFQSGGLSCLPSDFPKYPGATVTRDYTYFGSGVAPGDTRECQETLDASDPVETVTQFYLSQLNSGDWKINSTADLGVGQIGFGRVSRPQTVGVVQLLGRGQQTTVEIKLDS